MRVAAPAADHRKPQAWRIAKNRMTKQTAIANHGATPMNHPLTSVTTWMTAAATAASA